MTVSTRSSQIKVIFELDQTDWHGHSTESLWATAAKSVRTAQVDSCPFFVKGISYGDWINLIGDRGPFNYASVKKKSGYATRRVLIESYEIKADRVKRALTSLKKLGCIYEGGGVGDSQLFSIAVPPSVETADVVAVIDKGCKRDLWDAEVGDNGGRKGFWG